MTYYDSHAHYDDNRFDADREELLGTLPAGGVGGIINVGCDLESSRFAIDLAFRYDYIWAGVGLHPGDVDSYRAENLDELRCLAASPKVVAIGEIGLDYYYPDPDKVRQREMFIGQMEIARDRNLPVSLHDREAHAECLEIVKSFPTVRGVFHCYSGSPETAREIVKLGWYVGFTGVITFKNARKGPQVIAGLPAERILIETDCPYLAPEPCRGKRCDSSMLEYTLRRIAEIRGTGEDEMAERIAGNTRELFGIYPTL